MTVPDRIEASTPEPTTGTTRRGLHRARWRCQGCGHGARTRGEVADLSVEWLVYDPSLAAAVAARFHHGCRPAGVPGDGACSDCGDGPLIEPALDQPDDLLAAAALSAWLADHGWTETNHRSYCPACASGAAR